MKIIQVYNSIAVDMEEVREIFASELYSDTPCVEDMIEQVGKFRGKMLRPTLVLLCGKACGKIGRNHHVIAAVMEMIHIATLVHDDVLDEADTRRRGKTLNALHGNEAAVLLGDLLVSHAFGLCGLVGISSINRLISATTTTVCEGELMQLYYRGCMDVTEDRYLEIISKKTASLIGCCCYLGAELSGANEQKCQAFERFGLALGTAFQIADDITDLVGDEKTAGKTLGCDLEKGKITLPGIHFLQSCHAKDRASAARMLTSRNRQDRPRFAQQLRTAGSLDYARHRATEYIELAKSAIPDCCDSEVRNLLSEVAEAVVV